MAFDLKRSHASMVLSRLTSSGTIVDTEGKLLCAVLEDGVEKVTIVAAPQGTEKVLGWSRLGDAIPNRTSAVEMITVPTAPAALEVDLRNTNLVVGRVRAVDQNGVVLGIDPVYAGVPAAGTVKVDHPTGRMKYAAGQSGLAITVTYLYDLTLMQAQQKFGQRFINNWGLHAIFGQIEVATGIGELFTDQYDPTQDYTSAAALTLGANGIITKGGAGPALNASVVSIPSEANPMLGVRYTFFLAP